MDQFFTILENLTSGLNGPEKVTIALAFAIAGLAIYNKPAGIKQLKGSHIFDYLGAALLTFVLGSFIMRIF